MSGPRLIVCIGVVVAIAACAPTTVPVGPSGQTPRSFVASRAPSAAFEWPGEHKDSPELSFRSAADAVEFLAAQMDVDISLPTWVPSSVDLNTGTTVLLSTLDGRRQAQLKLTTRRGDVWGIQYGVSMLDGCAPEVSHPVKVSGQPGRLRVSGDPQGSSRMWTELVWPATLRHPVGVYGLFGGLPPRTVLAMADSMPPVRSQSGSPVLNC